MRVGIFTDSYPPYINGVSTSILMLKKGLEAKGHEVFVVCVNPKGAKTKYEEGGKVIRIPGIPIGIYDYRLSSIYSIKATKRIKKWNLDVIHSQTEWGIGTFARLIATQFKIPLVHTYHTMYEDYTHYITHGHFEKSSKKIVEYLTKFYCDKTIEELIVPTQKAYDLFKQKYKVARNIHIIPTGIDVDKFKKRNLNLPRIHLLRKELGLTPDDFIVLFIGRLGKEKNVDFLIDGHRDLVKKHPNMKLVIVGSGPDSDEFKQRVSRYHLNESIIFAGKVPFDDVPIYYNMADAFVTASRTETQGLTVIEAMASSLPVVCIDDESFRGTIINDHNGFLFKNRRQYCRELIDLATKPELYQRISRQAKRDANQHSIKYFAEQVLDVYRLAIEEKRHSRFPWFGKIKAVIRGDVDE